MLLIRMSQQQIALRTCQEMSKVELIMRLNRIPEIAALTRDISSPPLSRCTAWGTCCSDGPSPANPSQTILTTTHDIMDKETTPTPSQRPGAKYRGAVVEVSSSCHIGVGSSSRDRTCNYPPRFVWRNMIHYIQRWRRLMNGSLTISREYLWALNRSA